MAVPFRVSNSRALIRDLQPIADESWMLCDLMEDLRNPEAYSDSKNYFVDSDVSLLQKLEEVYLISQVRRSLVGSRGGWELPSC